MSTTSASLSSTSSPPSSITASIQSKLAASFEPTKLDIRNDSAKHAHHAAMVAQGGGSGETHFFVDITSQAFEGKTQIARHRQINALLADEFARGLHALSIRARTPAEDARAAASSS
ncbi:BolA domain UV induced protein Uvi31 [Tilletia horrida]|nr:BolA domain UV induced protein Uvi31 [Tilletia horrida]KAK0525453.1 BolA domain UV induced protein Uvi31 [Tilletia horrida]KAK0559142.1 BolA domain UV induced protein Uvi31 [Tilletia horrida]